MHIPDGFLSPQTAGAMYLASAPFLVKATNKLKASLNSRMIPYISIFSALTFVIMMFNIPLPGGTSGHATGAVVASIILGPWAAVVSTSIALVIQALFFGDGGVLALGANIFNIGIMMPLSGFFIYRMFASKTSNSNQKIILAGCAGYIAINIAALLTAIELGMQPIFYRDLNGQPLYFPYGLNISIPVMMLGHLLVAGIAEAIVTAFLIGWLMRVQPQLFLSTEMEATGKANRPIQIILGVLVILTPIGLLAPGTAWGEWSREELKAIGLGYIPAGFDKWSNFWRAPIADYQIKGADPSLIYILSASAGVVLIVSGLHLFFLLINKLKTKDISRP